MTRRKRDHEQVLRDLERLGMLDAASMEIQRLWKVSFDVAHGFVLSAIGEPKTLDDIRDALVESQRGLARLIIRRRVITLLSKDARPRSWSSLESQDAANVSNVGYEPDVRGRLASEQFIRAMRSALACFATGGEVQHRQATLLQRFDLDDANYDELSTEMQCSKPALRVRVFLARRAFGRHIRECHPELPGMR